MAKKMLLLIAILVVAAQAATATMTVPLPLSPADKKSINDLKLKMQEVVDAVVAAAPPAKQPEVRRAALAHLRTAEIALAKAIQTGDEKKLAHLFLSLEIAIAFVDKVPAEDKLKVMEDSFNESVAPNPRDCPAGDKSFCEMHDKVQKAYTEVKAAAPQDKRLEVQEAVIKKIMRPFDLTINKAYADGDEKKIARLLAAYKKAADAVIAAAPAEKLNVMEQAFTAAAKSEEK